MLDLIFLLFVGAVLVMGFRQPFLWVLAYLYVDILAPQKIGWGLTSSLKISLVTFCAAFLGWIAMDSHKKGARFTWRQGLMLVFLLYCWGTTMTAQFPEEAAEKWAWVWKGFVFAIFLPLTLTTRRRLEAALLVMLLSLAAITINAGLKTVGGGGGYGAINFLVNDNSGLYESSTLATVAIGCIPLILWFTKFGTIIPPDWRVKLFAAGMIFSCLLIPVGTEARTGLLCIAFLGLLMLREVKRPILYIFGAATLGLMALPFLPQSYYERMATLGAADGDESASTRIAVWKWTIDYAAEHPFGGGFDAYRSNKFTYMLPERSNDGNTSAVTYTQVTDKGRAYHSAYFEVLGEQGYVGFAMWIVLQISGLIQMEMIRRKWRKRQGNGEQWQAPLAVALLYAQLIYLLGAAFQGIAYQPFPLLLISIQCGFATYCHRLDSRSDAQKVANDGGNAHDGGNVRGGGTGGAHDRSGRGAGATKGARGARVNKGANAGRGVAMPAGQGLG